MSIQILPPEVSSMIAAGEVTERPASVVKELIENSIDAGATRISLEIRKGGIGYIKVSDNGIGIAKTEAALAFQRFATSKLTDSSDLDSISTLGFRGEALPSIGAVSKVALITRPHSETSGTRIDVENGHVVSIAPAGSPPGTSVIVQHLFQNVPARRKFLRSEATETKRTQTLVSRYVLAYPEVRFDFTVEGKTVFTSTGSGQLADAITVVYGGKTTEQMLAITDLGQTQEMDNVIVTGMTGPGSLSRADRNHVSLFVNRRWIQNRMLGYAIQEAYHGLMKERRYPVAVLNISLPYQTVDVNVHPAKSEIRLTNERQVFSAIQRVIRHTLVSESPVPEIKQPTVDTPYTHGPFTTKQLWPNLPNQRTYDPKNNSDQSAQRYHDHQTKSQALNNPVPLLPNQALHSLRVLGQIQKTYIAAEGTDGMYFIDQHAAHERIIFELVKTRDTTSEANIQGLMEAVAVTLDHRQDEFLQQHIEAVCQLGFRVEPFGERTYLLRGISDLIGASNPVQDFIDTLDLMAEGGGFESWEDRAAYSIACHGAIRAGKTLSDEEMEVLLSQLQNCAQPHTCPHGRPTIIHISSARLEREFGRR